LALRVVDGQPLGEGNRRDRVNQAIDIRPRQRHEDPVAMDVELHRHLARGRAQTRESTIDGLGKGINPRIAADADRPGLRAPSDLSNRLLVGKLRSTGQAKRSYDTPGAYATRVWTNRRAMFAVAA